MTYNGMEAPSFSTKICAFRPLCSVQADKTIARRQSRDEMREKISPLPGKVSEVELQSQDKSFDSLQSRASTLSDEDEGLDVRW